ncbi:MAG: S-adenosylmethionine decarboxylase family protein [Pseudonocardiales bacterium]
METNRTTVTVHRLAVVARGCHGDLTCGAEVSSAARRAAAASGLTLVAEATFAYVPHGLSVALLLAQSHLVISTWPEYRTATVDLSVCADQQAAHAVWSELDRYLQPATVETLSRTIDLTAYANKDQIM